MGENNTVLAKYAIDPNNIIKLVNKWDLGYAMAMHSISSELIDPVHNIFETKRTPLGQAIFLYKYRQTYYLRDELVNLAEIIIQRKFIEKIDLLTMPPPNTIREWQPVEKIAICVSSSLGIPLYKIAQKESGKTMKNLEMKDEKQKYLMENLYCDADNIKGKNILIIDDIFDTGATLDICTQKLKEQGCGKVYVLTFTKTR